MKNARYCTLLAAALLVSCQTAPKSSAGASPVPNTAVAASGTASSQEIPADTVLWIRLGKDLDSTRLKAGDRFSAQVSSPIVLNGKAVVPQGAPVQGVVVESNTATQAGGSGTLGLRITSVRMGLRSFALQTATVSLQSPPVRGSETERTAKREGDAFAPQGENLQFVITTAVSLR